MFKGKCALCTNIPITITCSFNNGYVTLPFQQISARETDTYVLQIGNSERQVTSTHVPVMLSALDYLLEAQCSRTFPRHTVQF